MITAMNNPTTEVHSSAMIVSSLRGEVEIVDKVADEWRGLCAKAADDQPFYRPEWIRAHIRAFIPNARVMIIMARRGGRLCLLLPLVEEIATFSGVPARRLRAPVNCYAGRFDAVRCAGEDGEAAIQATWKYLEGLAGWDLLQFRDTPGDSTSGRVVAAARASGFRCLRLADNPNPYIAVPSDPKRLKQMPPNSKLRSQLRQARRRLAELGRLNFYRVETADRDAIERFYQLEASGWKGREGSATLSDPKLRRFFDEIAESAARFSYFSLYMLELNGQLLAGHFALTYRGRCYSPIVAFNEDFRQFAPGHLIVSEILHDCAARGIYGYDITGQNQDWKMKWTNEARPVNHHFVFRGPLGALAYAVGTGLKPVVNRLFSGRQENRVKPAGVQEKSQTEEIYGFPGPSHVAR
jgi:CelD/BcsL family acetyltransferase involved in cellulose biosynthesis